MYEGRLALALFEQLAERHGALLLNTIPAFHEVAQQRAEPLFYDQDGHFTPAGHRVLAPAALNHRALLTLLWRLRPRHAREMKF